MSDPTMPPLQPSAEPLTWDDLIARCSRTVGHGNEQMLDVVITPPLSERGQEATVVPTRMHPPGFYVRAVNGTPTWAYWLLRSEDDLAMFRRFVEAGRVVAKQPADNAQAGERDV